jgi:hypothetical protein
VHWLTLPPFTLVSIHIPKTGGMSLREVLLREACGRPTFWIVDPVKDTAWLRSIPEEDRERWVLVEGHMYYGVHEWLPRPCVYMTMLRDPVERVLSLYSHIRERSDHHLHEAAEGLSVGECIRRGLTVEMDNFMVRAMTSVANAGVPFGGVTREMLEEAKGNLEKVKLVGLTERFEESLEYFGRELGWKGKDVPRVNVSGSRVRREEVGGELGLGEGVNELDAELYRFAMGLFQQRHTARSG